MYDRTLSTLQYTSGESISERVSVQMMDILITFYHIHHHHF